MILTGMDDKITIIEGPPPTFELIPGGWVTGIIDSPSPTNVAITRLRTFNGAELLERCHRAWRHNEPIHLEFRSEDGLTRQVPIVAARHTQIPDGDMLHLWVHLPEDDIEFEFDFFDEDDEEDFDDFDLI
jgi:hypothetical protein